MHHLAVKLTGALLVTAAAVALMASAPQEREGLGRPSELRVCVDPYDMPFSNDREEGFENKIAHLVARDLNATVINYWWPSRRGVLRNSILGGFCDVMIQAPVGLDPVATTKPYYRSTYYFVYRADRGLQIHSLDDTVLKHLKIGVNLIGYDQTNTPPAHALGPRGIVGLVGFGNFLNPDPKADHPEDIIDAVAGFDRRRDRVGAQSGILREARAGAVDAGRAARLGPGVGDAVRVRHGDGRAAP